MSKKQIRLHVEFTATYFDPDNPIPYDESEATLATDLAIPVIDPKFIVFPKVLEGITDQVVTELKAKVADFHRKQFEEEKRRKEEAQQPSFWRNGHGEEGEPETEEALGE